MNTSNGTLSDGSTGGVVSASNSLVGNAANDDVGSFGVYRLFTGASFGNALISSPNWNGNTGAVTWINGANGQLSDGMIGGVVSTSNSLLGSAPGEFLNEIYFFQGGNVLVRNHNWSNGGAASHAGSATWMDASTGLLSDGTSGGVISSNT